MPHYHISYTSSSEGITLGVSAEDWMSCLLALSKEFGDGVLPLYEKTREEMKDLFEAVAEAFSEEVEVHAKKVIQHTARQEYDQPGLEEAGQGSQGDGAPDDADAASGTSDEGGDTTSCAICGAAITADLATAGRLMYGEARCKSCTP